ncbi:hypothetical protein HYU07_04825 [Candidatus Woesearchaeota archaeon]|nr:hypothetical protein [Candidatus Woesearchaeota archaeon]
MVESNLLEIIDESGPEDPTKVVAFYILNAVRSSVNSIKLKPKKKVVNIFYDGSVEEQLPIARYASICERIKTMSGMDLSLKERQKP